MKAKIGLSLLTLSLFSFSALGESDAGTKPQLVSCRLIQPHCGMYEFSVEALGYGKFHANMIEEGIGIRYKYIDGGASLQPRLKDGGACELEVTVDEFPKFPFMVIDLSKTAKDKNGSLKLDPVDGTALELPGCSFECEILRPIVSKTCTLLKNI